MYDAAIGRWNAVDPLLEMYVSYTPYGYVKNNPVILYDLLGMADNKTVEDLVAEDQLAHDAINSDFGSGFDLYDPEYKEKEERVKKEQQDPKKKKKGKTIVDEIKEVVIAWIDQFKFSNVAETYEKASSGDKEARSKLKKLNQANKAVKFLNTAAPYYSIQIGKQGGSFAPELYGELTFYKGEIYFGPGIDWGGSAPTPSIGFSTGIMWGDASGFDYGGSIGAGGVGYEFSRSFQGDGGRVGLTFSTAGYWISGNASYSNTLEGYSNVYYEFVKVK